LRIWLWQPSNLAPVLDIEHAEVAGDVYRRTTGDAVGLLPAGQATALHWTIDARHQPLAAEILRGLTEQCLPDFPTGSHAFGFLKRKMPAQRADRAEQAFITCSDCGPSSARKPMKQQDYITTERIRPMT
jgi:hypothetical protein